MNEQVEVQVWRLESAGPFLATARVIISTDCGDIVIDRLKAIRNKQGKVWIALPQSSYRKDEKTVYKDILRLPSRLKKQIDDLILSELGEKAEK